MMTDEQLIENLRARMWACDCEAAAFRIEDLLARVAELEAERAQAQGYVTALRYIAWEAAGYMDCVHAAKRAIGEMGALPPPPKIQTARGEG